VAQQEAVGERVERPGSSGHVRWAVGRQRRLGDALERDECLSHDRAQLGEAGGVEVRLDLAQRVGPVGGVNGGGEAGGERRRAVAFRPGPSPSPPSAPPSINLASSVDRRVTKCRIASASSSSSDEKN
jgi:hypothetical protein